MNFLLLLPLLLIPFSPPQDPTVGDDAPVSVVSFKWFKDRRYVDANDATVSAKSETNEMDRRGKSETHKRSTENIGVLDSGRIEVRNPGIDRMVHDQLETKPPPVEGFTYQAKIQNKSNKAVKTVFLEFEFIEKANRANISRRQFVCRAKMNPDKREDVSAFSMNGPSSVVSIRSLSNKTDGDFQERVVINRVEYNDGSVWQRKGWNLDDVKLSLKSGSKRVQPCRGL